MFLDAVLSALREIATDGTMVALTAQEKAMLQEKRMEELSKDKRKLRKHQMRKEKKESAKEKKRMPQMRLG